MRFQCLSSLRVVAKRLCQPTKDALLQARHYPRANSDVPVPQSPDVRLSPRLPEVFQVFFGDAQVVEAFDQQDSGRGYGRSGQGQVQWSLIQTRTQLAAPLQLRSNPRTKRHLL